MTERESLKSQPEQFATDGLTQEEDLELATLLSKWNGGRISTPVFTELARIIPQPIVEVVLFRRNGEMLETLLIPRPADDIVWPGMLHTPGAAIRTADFHREDQNPLNGVFERIEHGELNSDFAYTPVFVGRLYRLGARGSEVAEVYFSELLERLQRRDHVWCPVDKLAENPKFIQHQLGYVTTAAEQYKKRINL